MRRGRRRPRAPHAVARTPRIGAPEPGSVARLEGEARAMSFVKAVPALAVSDVPRAVSFFVDLLGFDAVLAQADYGIVRRDAVELHLWAATGPEGSGAEPRLAGTTSCRVQVVGIAALYEHCRARQ